jgi:hypothetical protein
MAKTQKKRPIDVNQLASFLVAQATAHTNNSLPEKNAAAVALGRLGGLKGGHARAKKLSADRRRQIARKAALSRWASKKK